MRILASITPSTQAPPLGVSRFPDSVDFRRLPEVPGTQVTGNLSARLAAFNHTRAFARRTGILDEARTNRALGILMGGRLLSKVCQYDTSLWTCTCADSRFRKRWCKHLAALLMQCEAETLIAECRAGSCVGVDPG